jgi:hypothetical protein
MVQRIFARVAVVALLGVLSLSLVLAVVASAEQMSTNHAGCGAKCGHAPSAAIAFTTSGAPTASAPAWRAACGIGLGHPGGWYGPFRSSYADAKGDADGHNAGGGHGAIVIGYIVGPP